jgi:hypothetical protein
MKMGLQAMTTPHRYQAPAIFMGIFYVALIAWTLACIFLIGLKVARSEWGDLFQLFMIAFIMAMTWYFSMGVYYRIQVEEDGTLQLTSFRKILKTHSRKMVFIEGPPLPLGFIRFRMEGEKAYLFCVVKNAELQKILLALWKANPDLKFKKLRLLNLEGQGF